MDKSEKRFLLKLEEIVIAVSAIILILAAFLKWGQTPNFIETGLSGEGMITDGVLTIGIGVIALILLTIDMIYRVPAWIPLILGIVALIIGGMDFMAMGDVAKKYDGNIGMGLYLTVLASAGIILGSVVDIIRDRKK